jgi:hypothetical protein
MLCPLLALHLNLSLTLLATGPAPPLLPPSPGAAVLATLEPSVAALWLAQAENPEEKSLEDDMDSARKRLGHGDQPSPQNAPAPGVAPDNTRDNDGKRKHRRWALRPSVMSSPTVDGHGRGYYLGWGIADWSIAGGMWAAAAVTGFAALGLAAADLNDGGRRHTRAELRSLAAFVGVVSVSLGAGGGLVAFHARRNLETAWELRASGGSPSGPLRAPPPGAAPMPSPLPPVEGGEDERL